MPRSRQSKVKIGGTSSLHVFKRQEKLRDVYAQGIVTSLQYDHMNASSHAPKGSMACLAYVVRHLPYDAVVGDRQQGVRHNMQQELIKKVFGCQDSMSSSLEHNR